MFKKCLNGWNGTYMNTFMNIFMNILKDSKIFFSYTWCQYTTSHYSFIMARFLNCSFKHKTFRGWKYKRYKDYCYYYCYIKDVTVRKFVCPRFHCFMKKFKYHTCLWEKNNFVIYVDLINDDIIRKTSLHIYYVNIFSFYWLSLPCVWDL